MSQFSIHRLTSKVRQNYGHLFTMCLLVGMIGIQGITLAEGTKQLEPAGAPMNSICKIVLLQNNLENRIPFALIGCREEYRLNIRISDFTSEKIYLGFGNTINYFTDTTIYRDVSYQVKDPVGRVVSGYSLSSMPLPGTEGYIETRNQVDLGPDINNTTPGGYTPLVINPVMNGDYFIEFNIPSYVHNEIRVFKYFDVTVANGNTPVPGRLWSKAWQLGSGSVSAAKSASYSLFYIYTSDSIVTRFDCNGLAGGVWTIYSNEWGCSTTGTWSDRRRSTPGNATVQPEYKIFLNDPDPVVFPSGRIGEMIDFIQLTNECDTVVAFAADVSKGGNIEILLDVPPLNPNSIGPEDVQLGYNVTAGYNVLLPAWNVKNGLGFPIDNGTQVNASIKFLNGLSNIPLYDVEDNPKGFKVDIQRPLPFSGDTKLKLFWDDTSLPHTLFPTSNVTNGCLYTGQQPLSGCHEWVIQQNLGDTNTINSWWYLTTDVALRIPITLKLKPKASFSWYRNCLSQAIQLSDNSTGIGLASRRWDFGTAPVTTTNTDQQQPGAVFHASGKFPVRLMVANQYGCTDTVMKQITIHNLPSAEFVFEKPCQGTGIMFKDQSTAADTILKDYSWKVTSSSGDERTFHDSHPVIVFDDVSDYTMSLVVTDAFGCTDSASTILNIMPRPDCSFEIVQSPDLNIGELHFDNQTTGASSYSWDFGNNITSTLNEPIIKYNSEGNYVIMLVATSSEGCRDTATRQYYYMPGFWLPNAFSPDKNGYNDIFRPVTQRNTLEPYQLRVYSRWGELVFESSNPAEGWDGTLNGKPCNAGSYIYIVQYREAKIESSHIVTLRGMVSLIR